MKTHQFLRTTEIQALLERTTRVGNLAISLHEYAEDRERASVKACGSCAAACRHVSKLPWGKQACRRSREKAIAISARRGTPIAFLCHMGFSCVGISVLRSGDTRYALILGPFCPAETPDTLEADALEGLRALDADSVDALPFAVDDIPLVLAGAVPELAQWTAESMEDLSNVAFADEATGLEPEPNSSLVNSRHRISSRSARDPYHAVDVALALAGANQDQARDIVKSVITDTVGGKRASLAIKRARSVALVGAVLEASERAELTTEAAWERFSEFERAVRKAKNAREMWLCVMKVLGVLKRKVQRESLDGAFYQKLNSIVTQRIGERVTLNEIAKVIGQHPTAITHRLQRKFGMSFSEYAGRIRIDLAKDLLRDSKLKVSEVARRVGISDVGNFSKQFRKFEEMSPSEYRERFGRQK